MVAAGFATFVSMLQWTNGGFPFTLGMAFDLLPAALLLHLFLALPSGRLHRARERVLVAAAYTAAIGLQLLKMLLWDVDGRNVLAVADEPGVAFTVEGVELGLLSVISLTGLVVLAMKRRGLVRPLRSSEALLALGDMLVRLRANSAPTGVREALSAALRDPSLTLAYWLPEYGCWVDAQGRLMELPENGSEVATTLICRGGLPMAALVHDPSLTEEPELLDAVSAAAAIALENERLHAELQARLEELRGSRQRVIEAAQVERQRLERDLHDGAQQRLIALALELGRLERRLEGDDDAHTRLDRARREVALSLEEVRAVARGIHPAVVSGHGLAVAVESLAARAPVPVRLSVGLEGRMPERLEVAAYYVVSESLANVAKHARATSATVQVERDEGQLVVEVMDNGVGGADTERGTGLRGLADRVETLGGRLRIWTPRGGGTRVRAELPCA